MSNCLGTSSAAGSGTLSDTPVILDVRWRRGPDIAPWTHSWSSCIYSFKEISTDYLPYTGVHHSLRLCSLFYRLLCRVAIVLTSKVAACSTSSSLDQRPRLSLPLSRLPRAPHTGSAYRYNIPIFLFPTPPPTSPPPAVNDRFKLQALPHVKRANTFWSIYFMSSNGQQINREFIQSGRNFAHRLRCIAMHEHIVTASKLRNLGNWL